MKNFLIASCMTFLLFLGAFAKAQEKTNPKSQPKELGMVSWYRNYDRAIAQAKKENKAVFILFQEVPGCATCRNYGENVLSDPLLTEIIQNEFIPLAIYNNKGGADKEILKKFNEPAWNNPVVRIVDVTGKDLVSRVAGDYTILSLHKTMTKALKLRGAKIPQYATLLGEEIEATKLKGEHTAYYAMFCFWTGEKELGALPGVLNTEAGFMDGHEVVKVSYDPQVTSVTSIGNATKQFRFQETAADKSYRPATKDEDYYLQHSDFKYLPLSLLQRTKINAALGKGLNAEQYLSPKQLLWLQEAKKHSNGIVRFNSSFQAAWKAMLT